MRALTSIGHGRHQTSVLALFLFVGTALVYSNVVLFNFINVDDGLYVYESPLVRAGLTAAGVWTAFSTFINSNWHPLTTLSFMLDASIFGLNPGGFHFTNLLLHSVNAALVFLLFQRMTGRVMRSFLLALVFAMHPLRVESVAWVSERKDVLSACFALMTMLFYVRWTRSRRPSDFLFAWTCFVFGLLAKPMLVTLPFLLLLLDYWPLRRFGGATQNGDEVVGARPARSSWWAVFAEKLPFFLPSAAISVVTFIAQRDGGAMVLQEPRTLVDQIGHASVCYVLYLWKWFVPVHLAAFYPEPTAGFSLLARGGAAALLAALTLVSIARAKKDPCLIVGWLWFLGAMVPTIGFVRVGSQLIADRYTYIPQIGLVFGLIWVAADQLRRHAALMWPARGAAVAIVAALAMLTVRQVEVWENSFTLWTQAKEASPDPYYALNQLGAAFFEERRYSEALPYFEDLPRLKPNVIVGYQNLGYDLVKLGRVGEGVGWLTRAVDLGAQVPRSQVLLAEACERLNDLPAAETHWREAVRLVPADQTYLVSLASILARRGALAEAAQDFALATRLDPGWKQSLYARAWSLATDPDERARDGGTALLLSRRLVSADGERPEAQDALAAAYAETGDFAQASAAAAHAVRLAAAQPGGEKLRAAIQQRLDGYLQSVPFHRLKVR